MKRRTSHYRQQSRLPSGKMRLRVILRPPGGETVVRDIVEGRWAEPEGEADTELGAGSWAVPGLVDAHAHLARATMDLRPGDLAGAAARARRAMGAGVGLILDKGWRDDTTCRLIDRVPVEERPDIEAAGRVLAVPGGYWPGFTRELEPGELEPAVKQAAAEGRGWVKLVGDWPRKGIGPLPNFTEAELALAVRIAEEAGSRVAVHTMAPDVPSVAVRAGVHSIEHGMFLTPDDLELLGRRGGMWVPTVLQVEAVMAQLGAESSGGKLFARGLDNMRRMLGLAVEAGVHVLAGTDLVVGAHQVAAEAVRLWELGLSGEAVVAAAADSGYLATGRSRGFTPGDPAHAVLFPEDPAANPKILGHPERVLRWGRSLA